jgi:ParB family chromosome partitioning protein
MDHYYKDSVFWIDVDKIKPNPFQPRREFNQLELQSLADSIRQYGVLQALVVTRKEVPKEDGGLAVEYELIAGERRLRASKLAGVSQVPVLIKAGDESDLMKLELAIIENVQREDLNSVDRAKAFERLSTQFKLTHLEIARKVGKSREYVSNSLRILGLPADMLEGVTQGKISEGHTRPLLMLTEKPEEQQTLYKEIIYKKLSVRETENIARRIAFDKIRKKEYLVDPEIMEIEEKFTATLGTRVSIEKRENGGKISIDFFSTDDLRTILELMNRDKSSTSAPDSKNMLDKHIEAVEKGDYRSPVQQVMPGDEEKIMTEDTTPKEKQDMEEELYSIKNFSV